MASASHRPPVLLLGTQGLDLARHRPLPLGDWKTASPQFFSKRGSKCKHCKGAWGPSIICSLARIRSRPRVRQSYRTVGSPRTVASDHLLPVLSPLRPLTGARSPGRSGCTCARDPWPLYLVESDCIQGKGALGVQATAVLRSGEEEQKKGK